MQRVRERPDHLVLAFRGVGNEHLMLALGDSSTAQQRLHRVLGDVA